MRRTFFALTALVILGLGSGCIIEARDFGCSSDFDCFSEEVCDPSGFCVDDCVISGCTFSDEVCEPASGLCVVAPCESSFDCLDAEFCGVDGLCYEYQQTCLGSADCVGDGICLGSVCDMNYECSFDSDCPWLGSYCNEFGFCEYEL